MKPGQDRDGKMIGSVGRYWVVPGKLLAGPYPGAWEIEAQQGGIAGLLQAGISHFVDLTLEGETALSYQEMIPSPTPAIVYSMTHTRFSIPDMGTPLPEFMDRILDYLEVCLAQGNTVYLHCLGGLGRTGTVVGCYLVRRGFTGDEALEQLTYLRRNTSNRWKSSPETDEQKKYVRDWHGWLSRSEGR